jgi:hypothetical protein
MTVIYNSLASYGPRPRPAGHSFVQSSGTVFITRNLCSGRNWHERFTPLCFCNSFLFLALLWSLSDLQAVLLLKCPGRVVASKFDSGCFWSYDGLLLSGRGRIPETLSCDAWCLRWSRYVDASRRAASRPWRPIFVDAVRGSNKLCSLLLCCPAGCKTLPISLLLPLRHTSGVETFRELPLGYIQPFQWPDPIIVCE